MNTFENDFRKPLYSARESEKAIALSELRMNIRDAEEAGGAVEIKSGYKTFTLTEAKAAVAQYEQDFMAAVTQETQRLHPGLEGEALEQMAARRAGNILATLDNTDYISPGY